jgi:hypothetical protein
VVSGQGVGHWLPIAWVKTLFSLDVYAPLKLEIKENKFTIRKLVNIPWYFSDNREPSTAW